MVTRQGGVDCLCGVYSVLNATEIVIKKYKIDKSLKKKFNQKKALFRSFISYLAKNNMLVEALTEGLDEIDLKGGLIDIAIKSVKKHQKLKMRKQAAFAEEPDSLERFWKKLTHHLKHDNTAAIISISGRIDHWTCIKAITPEKLILADSSGIRHIYRHQCTLGADEKGMYTVLPTMTYLLSL